MIINIGCYRIELTKIKVTKIYSFDDLEEDIKETIVEKYWDINIFYEWWDCTYEDARNVGIIIQEFDIDRGAFCRGDIEDVEYTANKIIKEHGEYCETYKTAKAYLDYKKAYESDDRELELYVDDEFRYSILEDYRIMLQKEYEYMTSEDAIVETIKANYEFTVDGELV